jgi:hypothetical protein
MKCFEKIWDFAYGVVLIAGLPLVVLFGGRECLGLLAHTRWACGWWKHVLPLIVISVILSAILAFIGAIIIRKRKRLLPIWVLPIEGISGAVIGLWLLILIATIGFIYN